MIERKTVITEYVSDDGKAFTSKAACREWEDDMEREKEKEELLKKVLVNNNANGYMPFDGEEHYDSHQYTWIMLRSKEEIEEWNRVTYSEPVMVLDDMVGKWFCYEQDSYGNDELTVSLDWSVNYAKRFLKMFGLKMTVEPATRFSFEDLKHAQERIGTEYMDQVIDIINEYDYGHGDVDDVLDRYEDEGLGIEYGEDDSETEDEEI